MKAVTISSHVLVWIGAGVFIGLIFSVQIYLSMRQRYPEAVSDEVSEKSRVFIEETKQILEQRNGQTTP